MRHEQQPAVICPFERLVSSIYSLGSIGNLPLSATKVESEPTQNRNKQMTTEIINKNQSPSPIEVKFEPTT